MAISLTFSPAFYYEAAAFLDVGLNLLSLY